MITVGILADTHLAAANEPFRRQCAAAFDGCDIIIHAGDLTDASILTAFKGKEIHAVCGNMCNRHTRQTLPEEKVIVLDGFVIGVTHGAGPRHTIEDRVLLRFPEADCIVFGHTHTPMCQKIGGTLLINPGSFQGTGTYGAPGTYAILKIDKNGLDAGIHSLQNFL